MIRTKRETYFLRKWKNVGLLSPLHIHVPYKMEFCLSRIFAGLLVESWKPQHIILMRYGFQGYWKWKMEWSQLFMYAQEVASALLQGSNGIQVKLPSFLKPFSKSSNMMNGIENDHWVAIQYIFVKRRERKMMLGCWQNLLLQWSVLVDHFLELLNCRNFTNFRSLSDGWEPG